MRIDSVKIQCKSCGEFTEFKLWVQWNGEPVVCSCGEHNWDKCRAFETLNQMIKEREIENEKTLV